MNRAGYFNGKVLIVHEYYFKLDKDGLLSLPLQFTSSNN